MTALSVGHSKAVKEAGKACLTGSEDLTTDKSHECINEEAVQ